MYVFSLFFCHLWYSCRSVEYDSLELMRRVSRTCLSSRSEVSDVGVQAVTSASGRWGLDPGGVYAHKASLSRFFTLSATLCSSRFRSLIPGRLQTSASVFTPTEALVSLRSLVCLYALCTDQTHYVDLARYLDMQYTVFTPTEALIPLDRPSSARNLLYRSRQREGPL